MTIALITFSATYILLMLEKLPKYLISLIGALIIIASGVLSLNDAMSFVSWDTIGLLLGMFIIIKVLEEANFFNFMAVKIMEKLNFDIKKIYIVFPLITALLAGFMDSITVLIFFTILTINLCKMFDINPVPLVIAEVCTANIGGSGTLVGDPPNVIIGSVLNYTFSDFVRNTGPIAFISTIVVTLFFFLINFNKLKSIKKLNEGEKEQLILENKITNLKYVKIGGLSFIFAIVFLVTHHLLNEMFGFHIYASIATLLPAMVCLSLLKEESDNILRSIDGETLLFFIGLFIIIGSLEKTGVISVIAEKIIKLSNGNPILLSLSFIWICGIISAVVDNVPMALTMSYILLSIINQNPDLALCKDDFVWSLTLGLDIGGNMTPIGASANVMAYSILEKNKIHVGWKKWLMLAIPATIIALIVSTIGIYIKL